MRIDINEKDKIIALWFTKKENPQANLPKQIAEQIEIYRQKKYKICMYQSGNEDIKVNLLNLILNNV